ncbi:hypothetical protein T06_401 [Trichinella sp. T6]|nr:hypothetical protein T06_401 [Trichinella sp. T6]
MLFDKRWRCVTKVQVQNATFRHLIHQIFHIVNYAQHRAQQANDVRRMNNGAFNTMTDEEEQ